MAICVSLSPQLLRSWAWAGSRPIPRIPQQTPYWTSRPVSQSSRPGSGSQGGRFKGILQENPAIPKETQTSRRTSRPRAAFNVYPVLSPAVSGQRNAPSGKKATPEPSPVNSPSWSRFDVARDPNRTPLPRHQELPRGHEQARGSADRPSGAVREPGRRLLLRGDKFRGKAGVAPPRQGRGTEEGVASPFSSGIPARAPFRPLTPQTDDIPTTPQGDSASGHSGHSRSAPTPTPAVKTVKPDALHYEPTAYKDPVTSKYLVAKERFRPSVKKDWSAPQILSREHWLPRNTLNPRLVEGSQGAPSTAADYKNAMYKLQLPDPDAAAGSPSPLEAETSRDRPWEGRAPDDQAEAASLPQGAGITRAPPPPPRKSPNRAARDAKRRLELIERQRQRLCRKYGADPDTPGHARAGEIREALAEFIRQYDRKARRREGRRTEKQTSERKANASIARTGTAHREEARQQARRLAGAILGPASSSA